MSKAQKFIESIKEEKCIKCGKKIKKGEGRYVTSDGSYCKDCWGKVK